AESVGKVFDYYSQKFGPPPSSSFRIVEVEGANWNSQWSVGMLLLPSSQLRKDFDLSVLAATVAHQWFPLKIGVKDPGADAWLVQYKGAFVLRMLRWVVGDENFDKLLSRYMQQFQNTAASTEAFEKLTSEVAGGDLGYFFDQWLNGSGVPEFKVAYTVFRMKDGYKVLGQVKQDLDLFKMPVEFQIQTDGDPEYARVDVVGESSEFEVKTERKPKGVAIDPK